MENIKNELMDIFKDIDSQVSLDGEEDFDLPLVSVGIDSLDKMTMFLDIESKFGLDSPGEDVIDDLNTFNQILSYIKDELSKK